MVPRALVVEDDLVVGDIVARYLQNWGFEPTVLHEGLPVVPWVQQHHPDLIVLDLMLPDIDGFQICEKLKLERDTNLIPIIMATALTGDEDQMKGLKVGANHYLKKPYSGEELKEAVQIALAWKEDIQRRGAHGEVRFELRSDTNYLEELNGLLSSMFLFSGLTESQANQLTTAVRELGTNAIEWGHKKQVERIVTVDYQIDAEKITIVIRDTGPGFNPQQLPHAASDEDPIAHMMVREALGIREGGFGILMSRGLVDEMRYNEAGNEVLLVKYFPARAAKVANGSA